MDHPGGAQGNRRAGIGNAFSDEDVTINAKIENYLAGSLAQERFTHTLCSPETPSKKAGPEGPVVIDF